MKVRDKATNILRRFKATYPLAFEFDDFDSIPQSGEWQAFVRAFRAEMNQPAASRTLDLLAALSHGADFSVGCYCEDEARCHRSVLKALLTERGAAIA